MNRNPVKFDGVVIDDWGEQVLPPPSPAPTPDEKFERELARAGIGRGSDDNPLTNPLWLNDAQRAQREYIRGKLEEYRAGHPFSDPVFIDVRVQPSNRAPNGVELMPAHDYLLLQDKEVYDLLIAGVDIRQIAASTHTTVEEVREVAQRHSIPVRA